MGDAASRNARSRPSCVHCEMPALAGEHVFFAGLGGRRTYGKILCVDHERQLRPVVTAIVNQFSSLCALIGVRPDHADGPKPAILRDEQTEIEWLVDSEMRARLRNPLVIEQKLEDGRTLIKARFPDQKHADDWRGEHRRKSGKRPTELKPAPSDLPFLGGMPQLLLAFGGQDVYRGLAQLALNHVALRHPEIARATRLAPFRGYILGDTTGEFVRWADASRTSLTPAKAPSLVHRVTVNVSEDGIVEALLEILGFTFLVTLGSLGKPTPAATTVWTIDPTKERPHELDQQTNGTPLSGVTTVSDEEGMRDGVARYFHALRERRWNTRGSRLLARFAAVPLSPWWEVESKVRAIVFEDCLPDARGILLRVAARMRRHGLPLDEFLDILLETDVTQDCGLSPAATHAVTLTAMKLGSLVTGHLRAGTLTLETLRASLWDEDAFRAASHLMVGLATDDFDLALR